SASTRMASLPPISTTTRLIQRWPSAGCAASSLIRSPTSFDPVNATNRVSGSLTSASPIAAPLPVTNDSASGGHPDASSTSTNCAAIVGESLEGLSTTVFPVTSAATVMPVAIASGKFHGG